LVNSIDYDYSVVIDYDWRLRLPHVWYM